MTDIVQRLNNASYENAPSRCMEAAEEIARLRDQNSQLWTDLQAAKAENERLRRPASRFINCETCQTEGRILTNDGGPDDVDHGICPACNGERVVEVETQSCDFLTECPSCKQMYENGGQCAAPVMRGGCPMGGDF